MQLKRQTYTNFVLNIYIFFYLIFYSTVTLHLYILPVPDIGKKIVLFKSIFSNRYLVIQQKILIIPLGSITKYNML